MVVVVIAVVVVGAVVVGLVRRWVGYPSWWLTLIWHYIRSRRSGSWRLKKQTRDIFSPVEVVVNSHHENQIEVTEVGEVFEVEVMNQTGKVETNMDEVDGATEREYVNCPSDG